MNADFNGTEERESSGGPRLDKITIHLFLKLIFSNVLETCESEISVRIESRMESAARFEFESNLESHRRIIVYSFNVNYSLIAI